MSCFLIYGRRYDGDNSLGELIDVVKTVDNETREAVRLSDHMLKNFYVVEADDKVGEDKLQELILKKELGNKIIIEDTSKLEPQGKKISVVAYVPVKQLTILEVIK